MNVPRAIAISLLFHASVLTVAFLGSRARDTAELTTEDDHFQQTRLAKFIRQHGAPHASGRRDDGPRAKGAPSGAGAASAPSPKPPETEESGASESPDTAETPPTPESDDTDPSPPAAEPDPSVDESEKDSSESDETRPENKQARIRPTFNPPGNADPIPADERRPLPGEDESPDPTTSEESDDASGSTSRNTHTGDESSNSASASLSGEGEATSASGSGTSGTAASGSSGDGSGSSRAGGGGSVDLAALRRGYNRSLFEYIRTHAEYPPLASRANLEGRVVVDVVIDEDGEILSVELHDSSDHKLLDQAALETLRQLDSLPAPPGQLGWTEKRIRIPIPYRLE